MTPEDRRLDRSLFIRPELTLYRIASAKYANLSGIGAAFQPGRWNKHGQEAIYTSIEVSTPILERLAHTPKDQIPRNLALMEISLRGEWVSIDHFVVDPKDRAVILIFSTLAEAREVLPISSFLFGPGEVIAAAIPSVIVPVWNVVLFPRLEQFWNHVHLRSVEPFEFDPRLFPTTAIPE